MRMEFSLEGVKDLRRVIKCASDNESRMDLAAVYFVARDGQVSVSATNGYVLGMIRDIGRCTIDGEALIEAKPLKALFRQPLSTFRNGLTIDIGMEQARVEGGWGTRDAYVSLVNKPWVHAQAYRLMEEATDPPECANWFDPQLLKTVADFFGGNPVQIFADPAKKWDSQWRFHGRDRDLLLMPMIKRGEP